MPFVSVVTPVYNGERYLAACIESVLSQSFTDFEYVIVDNCSSDQSRRIAEHYARGDARIRIYSNKALLPVTDSFNRAAECVSADARYVKFVCADDIIFPDCLKMMVDVAEANPDITVVGAYKICGFSPVCDGPPFPQTMMTGKAVCKQFFEGRLGLLGSPTSQLIRLPTDSVGGQLFDRDFLHSDIELYVRLLKGGGQLGFVHQVLTFTRIHDETVSSFAHLMGTGSLESLAILIRHGRAFLSEREYRKLVKAHRKTYSRFLFRIFLKVWDRRIWRYQVASWKKLDIHVGLLEVLRAGLWETAVSAMSPGKALRSLRNEYSRAWTRRRLRPTKETLSSPRPPEVAQNDI